MNEVDDEVERLVLELSEAKQRKRQLENQSSIVSNDERTANRDVDVAETFGVVDQKTPTTPALERSDNSESSFATSTSGSSTNSSTSTLVENYPASCPNPFLVAPMELSQDDFLDRLSIRLSEQSMGFYLQNEFQIFNDYRNTFLANLQGEDVLFEDLPVTFNQTEFRDAFSFIITLGVLSKRAVRITGIKGVSEDSPVRNQFLRLVYKLWNILGILF